MSRRVEAPLREAGGIEGLILQHPYPYLVIFEDRMQINCLVQTQITGTYPGSCHLNSRRNGTQHRMGVSYGHIPLNKGPRVWCHCLACWIQAVSRRG
jgi:hypothetical protein